MEKKDQGLRDAIKKIKVNLPPLEMFTKEKLKTGKASGDDISDALDILGVDLECNPELET